MTTRKEEVQHITDMPYCWCDPEIQKHPNGALHIIHKKETYKEFMNQKNKPLKELIIEKLQEEIDIITLGIEACKEDSAEDNCKGNELHYIFGKSQALKIIKERFVDLLELIKLYD